MLIPSLVVLLGQNPTQAPLLLRHPALSQTQIVFNYAGDLWSIPRSGGEAKHLTSGVGQESYASFSPDGKWLAFTGEYDGNADVYVMPAEGGEPRRLTYHPSRDQVCGWSPDGSKILFMSERQSAVPQPKLFTIAREGGIAEALPFPTGSEGSFSPDGKRVAYVPIAQWQNAWKGYRGGQTRPIWLADLATSHTEKLPRENSNDFNPLWVGDSIYFLSDREGVVGLYRYDLKSRKTQKALGSDGLDFKSAAAGPGGIVVEQFGSLKLYDTATGKAQALSVTIKADLPTLRPHYVPVGSLLTTGSLSPTGARAVLEARGEILTVPAEKGDVRNLTRSPSTMERSPAWSPDGTQIAYFTDEGGEYQLAVRGQREQDTVKKWALGGSPAFYYQPVWSPDSKKLSYRDNHLNFWYLDLTTGVNTKLDRNTYYDPLPDQSPVWSPDSRWLVYARKQPNHVYAVCLYSLATGKVTQVTDGLSDALLPEFDKNGKYLYFTASTNSGPANAWLDLSSVNRPINRKVYALVLSRKEPSPLAPESDDEKEPEKEKKEPTKAPEPTLTQIDLEGLSQRIVALPIPARNYSKLIAGKAGSFFLLASPDIGSPETLSSLSRFDIAERKLVPFGSVSNVAITANGEKLLLQQGTELQLVSATTPTPPAPGTGALNLASLEVLATPRAEWAQMYDDVWRIQRDFFYDPGLHGLNLAAARAKYAPYLKAVASRDELNYLFEEMLGEIRVGHMFVGGGDQPTSKPVPVGLLGADYTVENGHWRLTKIYTGESWNPELKAPLAQPGVDARVGDYVLEVNGRPVLTTDEIYKYFEATASKTVTLKLSQNPDGSEPRDVRVVPVANEAGLRVFSWVEENRRLVERLSGGRIAYVWLPDTANGGYDFFTRYFFAQLGKEGIIVDERYNQGGYIADYVIDYLRRPLMGFFTQRDGLDYQTPSASILGPKVMLINELAGSGGDALPWMFRKAELGPLIGKRTWGGLVGILDFPVLMDGGRVTSPNTAFWNPNGTWDVENRGVAPDIEVELDPEALRQGHDLQLERAIQYALEELKKHPLPKFQKPAYPNYHRTDDLKR